MMFSAVAARRRGAMARRLAWDFPRGGEAHAGVPAAVWFTPLLTNPDVVAGLRRAARPFLSDSSTMSPGRYAERLS